MNLQFLRFFAQPAFVIPWYVVDATAAMWVLYDTFTANRQVTPRKPGGRIVSLLPTHGRKSSAPTFIVSRGTDWGS